MSDSLSFPPFRFDPTEARLMRGAEIIPLRPKTLAILEVLARRAGSLVTKEELLDAVWPDTAVSEAALKVCVRELRAALGDDPKTPRFIQTAHRLGYRFIAEVQAAESPRPSALLRRTAAPARRLIVGREGPFERLWQCLEESLAARRQVVFLTGEPGIGKTTLLEELLEEVTEAQETGAWIVRGQCVGHYGTVEAFLPLLEGFTRLCRAPEGDRFIALLREHAPSWLVEIPGALSAAEHETLRRGLTGGTRERMLREMVVGLEALSAAAPIVLALEDLHWIDHSTLDLLAALARRHDPARLLVVATYRPFDRLAGGHPLAAMAEELKLHRHALEIGLERLPTKVVHEYLTARLGNAELAAELAPLLHKHTDGNPLFLVNTVDHLIERGLVRAEGSGRAMRAPVAEIEREVPRSLHAMLLGQVDALDPHLRAALEAASVVGLELPGQALAAALEAPAGEVQEICRTLGGLRLLQASGESDWPDGTHAMRYVFTHTLYREALYERLSPERRAGLHRRVAERTEAGFVERAREVAAELAMHFGEAGDIGRTVKYLRLAGEAALRRHAYQESITQLGRALELLDSLPAEEDRDALELELRVLIGVPLLNTRGFAAAEVEATYSRALELCRRRAGTPRLFPVLEGLHTYYAVRGDLRTAWELARQMLDLANASHEPTKMLEAHHTVGTTAFRLAELVTARAHLDQAIAVYDPANGAVAFEQSGHDPRVCCQGYLGVTLWLTGYPDQGLRQALEALAYARTIGHAYTLAVAQSIAAWVHLLRREARQGRSLAESIVALSSEQSFPYYLGLGLMLGGWARTLQGDGEAGLDQLRQGFSICEAIGAGVGRLEYLAMVANSCVRMDRSVEGMAALDEAFALQEAHGERYFAPELHRLRGELLLRAAEPSPGDAEAAFCCALDTARADGTTSLELRAATSLARLLKRDAGARAHVRETLVSVADRFSEGLETADLRDAHAVLREL